MNILLPALIAFIAIIWFWALLDLSRIIIPNPWIKTIYLLLTLGLPLLGPLVYFMSKRHFRGAPRKFEPTFNR
ncbi:MAG: hypothetical protein RIF46_12180 [Cyclobacteriaceae bacterium]